LQPWLVAARLSIRATRKAWRRWKRFAHVGKETPGDMFYRALSFDRLKQPRQALEAYQRFAAASQGKLPDQEFQARQRIRIIERELQKRR